MKMIKTWWNCDLVGPQNNLVSDAQHTIRCCLLCLPLGQQPHAGSTQDVERRLFVFVLRDVSGGEAEERVEVVAGLSWCLRQGGDTWNHQNTHFSTIKVQKNKKQNYNIHRNDFSL